MKVEEIKNKLIKKGFYEVTSGVLQYGKDRIMISVIFQEDSRYSLLIDTDDANIIIQNPIIERIEALVYGLIGTKI
jgi:hypothetical protein